MVQKRFNKKLVRLEGMPSISPDYKLKRNYLEPVLELRWKKQMEDDLDLEHARRVLD